MRLTELLIEGLPNSKGAVTFKFDPGLTVLRPGGSFPASALSELLLTLFYPLYGSGASLGPGKARRCVLSFEVSDGVYRITRDYAAKRSALARLQPGGEGVFRDISSEASFITGFLTRSARLPGIETFREVLIARPGDSGGDTRAATLPGEAAAAARGAIDPGRRLGELVAERENVARLSSLETELTELHEMEFRMEDQLRRLEEPKGDLDAARKEYEPFALFDEPGLVTETLLSRLKVFTKVKETHGDEVRRIDERLAQLADEIDSIPIKPWWKESLFRGGAVGVIFGVVASSVDRRVLLLAFAVLLVGLVVAFLGYLQNTKRSRRVEYLRGRVKEAESEKAGVVKRYEIETQAVRTFCEKVREPDTLEVERMLSRREELSGAVKAAERKLDRMKATIGEDSLRAEAEEVKSRRHKIEEEMSSMPPVSMEPNALEREIARLKNEQTRQDPLESVSPGDDCVNRLFVSASSVVERPAEDMLRGGLAGLAANLGVTTARAFTSAKAGRGGIEGFVTKDGRLMRWEAADEETRKRLRFAVQFTMWQIVSGAKALPFMLDLAAGSLPPGLGDVSLAAAKHLAKRAQVLAVVP